MGIFFWIFSGLQGLVFLLFLVYTVFLGIWMIAIVTHDSPDAGQKALYPGVIFLIFLVYSFLILVSVLIHIVAGYGLRKGRSWARRWGIVGSIAAVCSIFFGGIMLFPFGLGLGIYCLWFLFSEQGKHFPGGSVQHSYGSQPAGEWG